MPNQIPEQIKAVRLAKLDGFLNELQREFNERCIGQTFECLYEGPDKTGNHSVYRTPYMQQCIVDASEKAPAIANIKITAANKASLRGEIVK